MPTDLEVEAAKRAFLRMFLYIERNADLCGLTGAQKMNVVVDLGIPAALDAAEAARDAKR